ncbi:Delta-aminolevulinic acid dehydratase [Rhynchospora pubera]|uniref:Delta-aminolevulinic acid dehydratase n=1 Tax=Rhynchospora pubera TaxID=906938 RepID=A0AAV8ENE0_9POAL|nr:Delta-aminolevulinic acid dehydratase [Rhynchospora pubera]KAJ4786543.1 Delta-aminolevulinic acid dehydratase [Rhynchospora pubera]
MQSARAGADVVSPSDMMDGQVGALRAALDAEGFHDVSIMSYTAKYQMNPANYREALIEADEAEGADILLVKPGLPYTDVICLLRDNSALPIAAYQVSGEYSMIKASVLKMIDEERVMIRAENGSMLGDDGVVDVIGRAGADIILSYFARQAAGILCGAKSN